MWPRPSPVESTELGAQTTAPMPRSSWKGTSAAFHHGSAPRRGDSPRGPDLESTSSEIEEVIPSQDLGEGEVQNPCDLPGLSAVRGEAATPAWAGIGTTSIWCLNGSVEAESRATTGLDSVTSDGVFVPEPDRAIVAGLTSDTGVTSAQSGTEVDPRLRSRCAYAPRCRRGCRTSAPPRPRTSAAATISRA